MLSVLSTGTLALSEQLSHARHETQRLRGDNQQLLDVLDRRRGAAVRTIDAGVSGLRALRSRLLKQRAFFAFKGARHPLLMWQRYGTSIQRHRAIAWRWLWARRMMSRWRHAAYVKKLTELQERHSLASERARVESGQLRARLAEAERRNQDLEAVLCCERGRAAELEATVEHLQAQVNDAQSALKGCYVRQFEEAQQRERLEQRCEELHATIEQVQKEKDGLGQEVRNKLDELARADAMRSERDFKLNEAAGELCLAEEVIGDIMNTKCIGLQRFFQKYNMPKVLLCLFRRVMELQGQLRDRGWLLSGREASTPVSCAASLISSSASSQSSRASALETEVRHHLSLHGDGAVSRHSLQVYIENLHLLQVSAGMVTQVVLALLDLDLGDRSCEASRFVGLLQSPPDWEELRFATALWGSAGEPAAVVVQQHRRQMARAASHGAGVCSRGTPCRGPSTASRRTSPAAPSRCTRPGARPNGVSPGLRGGVPAA